MFYGILLLINIYLKLIFHFIGIFIFIFWTALFHCLSPFFLNFHLLLHHLFFFFNNKLFTVFLPSLSLGTFTRDWFTCFIDAMVYFISIAEQFFTIISLELSVLFLETFFTSIFQCQCFVTCHTHRRINFHDGCGSCDFLNYI